MIIWFTPLWFILRFGPQPIDALIGSEIRRLDAENQVLYFVCVIAVSYTHLTLPTICSV